MKLRCFQHENKNMKVIMTLLFNFKRNCPWVGHRLDFRDRRKWKEIQSEINLSRSSLPSSHPPPKNLPYTGILFKYSNHRKLLLPIFSLQLSVFNQVYLISYFKNNRLNIYIYKDIIYKSVSDKSKRKENMQITVLSRICY